MATGRLRTHLTARKIERQQVQFTNCSILDAVLSAAASVEWLAGGMGAIIVADTAGRFITRVWSAAAFERYCHDKANARTVGHYVLEQDVSTEPRDSVRLLLEIPA
jgi:tellurite resistance protein